MKFRYTSHAEKQLMERKISKKQVCEAVANPVKKVHLLVLTVYRTTKIQKYWRVNNL